MGSPLYLVSILLEIFAGSEMLPFWQGINLLNLSHIVADIRKKEAIILLERKIENAPSVFFKILFDACFQCFQFRHSKIT